MDLGLSRDREAFLFLFGGHAERISMIEFLCTLAGMVAGVAITASCLSVRHDQVEQELENLRHELHQLQQR